MDHQRRRRHSGRSGGSWTVLPEGRGGPFAVVNFMWSEWDVDQTPSVAAAVTMWLQALREGHFWWEPESGEWLTGIGELPPELRSFVVQG